WLGSRANSQAALPAFILGLVMSGHHVHHRQEQDRMRVVAFAFLTPLTSLYGLNAGIIDRTQFSLLLAVVVLSAIVPTAIAQRFYSPRTEELRDITAPVPPAGLAES